MADELRSCRRTGCRWPAAASLSYRYDSRQVWLLDLAGDAHPTLYDLCPHHADHLTLPRGWHLVDQRTVPEVIVEPAAVDRGAQPVTRPEAPEAALSSAARPQAPRSGSGVAPEAAPSGTGSWTAGRYAALLADLPRLAASLADHPDLQAPDLQAPDLQPPDLQAPDVQASDLQRPALKTPGLQTAQPQTPDPHAARAAEEGARPGSATVVRRHGATHEHGQLPGQLALPVDELPPLGSSRGAVVVSIQRAGGRRREARDFEF